MGKNKNAGSQAAAAANKFTQLGIDELKPFLEAGKGQLGALEHGATAGGLDARLAEILNTDTFGALQDERTRAVQGQLSAGGLTRSGAGLEAIANVPTELALQLENMLTGRSSSLTNQGLDAGRSVASLFSSQGENVSSGIITDAETKASAFGNALKLGSSIFFSDERLKDNVVQISDIMGLPIVEWDWIPQTKGTIIEGNPTVGFLAQDVRDKYPEFVGEYSGWLFVDYENLMRKLQSNLNDKIAAEAA